MSRNDTMQRMWINQPSTLQPHHNLHGVRVLARSERDTPDCWRAYFLAGPVHSMRIARSALSDGWPKHLCNDDEKEN